MQSPLINIARALEIIDRLILHEWEGGTLQDHSRDGAGSYGQNLLTRTICLQAHEDIDAYYEEIQTGISHAASEATTLRYLADTTCLAAWSRVYLLVVLQQRSSGQTAPTKPRCRASEILNLAITVSELYDSDEVQNILFPEHEDVAASIEAKLDSLSLFADVFSLLAANDSEGYGRLHSLSTTCNGRRAKFRTRKPARTVRGHQKIIITTMITAVAVGAVLVGFAYHLSGTSAPGSTSDADFWFLIQNSFIQLLGLIITALASLWSRNGEQAKFLERPRLVTRSLSGIGLGCALSAPLCYMRAPAMANAVVSLVGSAMQVCVMMQLTLSGDVGSKEVKEE
ncbi:MAG: hypothetical protein Q9219_001274 [cf. Caloplaca sp. 3 TL-2023]